ncbi:MULTISPECIES: DNA-binding response regulator [unclassified Streptomyces]|uniref:DNA-binding response regulator n=1 Tax=unclassified Streptomyces TaxID=2593676 RepID=UPI0023659C0A|nr:MULTISPECIES: DNA-binding response regulator [unclassified Streptomyces]MDF3147195.1 DNA-binding response regulator [Streptomyces sp. T21Q-yed]WDF42574.1 DNA-binding response regulator [Streptomyces sp. T12]
MPQVMELRGDVEFWARIKPLAESDDVEWVHIARDLDTWPGAREAARRQARRGRAPRARKLYSPAVLADERDRDALREMAAHGFQVRIATAPLPQGTVIIDRRTMILTGPVPSAPAAQGPRTYTMSASPALIGGAYALFEAAWESAADLATFLDSRRPRMDDQTSKVLHALCSGATDETAARELGMSLRTYRRRVAELLVGLDAASRFQAGVRAGELGLIRR